MTAPLEDGLHVIDDVGADEVDEHEALAAEDGVVPAEVRTDGDLERLRDAFVEGFNSRDVEVLTSLVHDEVECPDIPEADGPEALAEEVEAIWERAPEAFLTRGFLDDAPVAIAWRPDEDGRWIRVALVTFDEVDGLLTVVELPDDVDALERAEAEGPAEAQLEEWVDWAEWDRGEETITSDGAPTRP
jgi:hypothetical protein